ncbi:MAG: CvpA family protein [Rhodospirillaceae bacterium]|jgi:membrane protein required for colicin V production|nr:CvpA family protein [Rhodospirillaceae bacterium]MBT3491179.1 CvpA family protein [Rhodospirillaceae bacterium]MBT3781198.1 CvpA family protein [Rhodospirillaceae bacterium]MBT3979482.1 CvpA family protein [Rhodospirillaceae bacterium]MBT4168047.1 CvpA family protein [Rhodospirillaceae bacterium]
MLSDLPINVTDLVVLILLLVSGLLALGRGFVKEVLSIGGWIVATVATIGLFPYVQPMVQKYVDQPLIAGSITTVVVFVAVLTAASFLSSAISRRVQRSEIGVLDRSLGFLFGLLRGAAVIALAYIVLLQFLPAKDQPDWLRQARAMPAIEYSAQMLAGLAPENVRDGLAGIGDLGRGGGQNLDSILDNAINAGRSAEQLKGAIGGANKSPNSDADKQRESGYTSGSRDDMNRLIQNRTDN